MILSRLNIYFERRQVPINKIIQVYAAVFPLKNKGLFT